MPEKSVRRRQMVGLLVPILASLANCSSTVDQFSRRSIVYDLEAEKVRDQALLLNVVRAISRRPMMFVDVGAVTGTGSLSGTGTLTIPWLLNSASMGTGSFAPQATISGSQNFTLTPLVNAEFYRGIMSPVDNRELAYLISEGMSREELLKLAIERITFTVKDGAFGASKVFENDPNGENPKNFNSELRKLIDLGLTVEENDSLKPLTPPIPPADLRDISRFRGLPDGTVVALYKSPDADPNYSKTERGFTPAGEYFRLVKPKPDATFCFHPKQVDAYYPSPRTALTLLHKSPDQFNSLYVNESFIGNQVEDRGEVDYEIPIDQSLCSNIIDPQVKSGASVASGKAGVTSLLLYSGPSETKQINGKSAPGPTVKVEIAVRSVEAMLYYLGSISRGLQSGKESIVPEARLLPAEVGIKRPQSILFDMHWESARSGRDCFAGRNNSEISVCYEGRRYWVQVDPKLDAERAPDGSDDPRLANIPTDNSVHVLSILSQLIALNNSAKDLPAPSSVTLIGH